MAAGLGCRDTLRLEAAMPLYGHELTEDIDPLSGRAWTSPSISKAASFPGRDALAKLQADATLPRRVGLELSGKRVPREGYAIAAATASRSAT